MRIEELIMQLETGSIQPYVGTLTDDSVFLERITRFERIYRLRWFEFMERLNEHTLVPRTDQERLDFAEWGMLCRKFEDKLEDNLEGLTIMASPPPDFHTYEETQGPSNRAFCFGMLKLIYGAHPQFRSPTKAVGRSSYIFQPR